MRLLILIIFAMAVGCSKNESPGDGMGVKCSPEQRVHNEHREKLSLKIGTIREEWVECGRNHSEKLIKIKDRKKYKSHPKLDEVCGDVESFQTKIRPIYDELGRTRFFRCDRWSDIIELDLGKLKESIK